MSDSPSPNPGDELGRIYMSGSKSSDKGRWATLNECVTVKGEDSEREERDNEERSADIHIKKRRDRDGR